MSTQAPTATVQPRLTVADLDPAERTPCERWTRVMGYHRPVAAFNRGKQAEHAQRVYFRADNAAGAGA